MNYKERFIALLNEMIADKNAGMIPMMISEGLKECNDKNKDSLLYYTISNLGKT